MGFGQRGNEHVVLKLAKQPGDEWHSGEVLRAFSGDGMVRVLESEAGAVLLERLQPGTELVELVRRGNDELATEILAQVIRQTADHSPPANCPTVLDWGLGFDRYISSDNSQISAATVNEARELFQTLAESQRSSMLLHGDLHHYNVLFDEKRDWVAIDPKGVVGEMEYEVGALLRNPIEKPELLTSETTVARRVEFLVTELRLDYYRTVAWSFAQSVLSAIWEIEDGRTLTPDNSTLRLAQTLKRML